MLEFPGKAGGVRHPTLHKIALTQAVPVLCGVFFMGGLKWARQNHLAGIDMES